jgi:integrase
MARSMVLSMDGPDTICERTMARALNRLTVKKVQKLLRNGVVGPHADGAGLYLRIRSKTSASWEKQYQPRGAQPRITKTGKEGWPVKYMGLGSAFDVSLDEAREANRAANKLLRDKIDPLATRRAERAQRLADAAKQQTFGEAARDFYNAHVRSWDAVHAAQWARSVLGTTPSGKPPKSDLCKALRSMPVASITTQTVVDVLTPIWHSHHESASRLRNRVEAVLDMAKARGLRSGDNPAASLFINELLPVPKKTEKRHFNAMPYADLPGFMAALRQRQGSAERALEFLTLTVGRTDEVLGAEWKEINFDKRIWTVPANRMKTRQEHKVPLVQAAVDLLDALPRDYHDLVFLSSQAGKPLSAETMLRVLRRMGRSETVHGLRSSFHDWAAETKGPDIAPLHIIEMCLAHKVGNAITEAYRHTDLLAKRRVLLDAWAEFCTSRGADVVPMRRPAR